MFVLIQSKTFDVPIIFVFKVSDGLIKDSLTKGWAARWNIMLGLIELVKFFSTEVGVKIDITDGFGNTALMKASEKGHVEIAEYLIINGANVNFQNKEGVTPLMVAAEKNNFYIFKLLIDQNADISKSDYTGRTIKEIAENSRDKRILKLLN